MYSLQWILVGFLLLHANSFRPQQADGYQARVFYKGLSYEAKPSVTICVGLGFWWTGTKTTHLKAMIACRTLLVAKFAVVPGNNMLHI